MDNLKRRQADSVASLVELALNEHHLSGLSKMLECIARESSAYGAVLWELSEHETASGEPHFFPLAQWFPESVLWPDPMPLESACGHAVLQKLPYYNRRDIQDTNERFVYRGPFLVKVRSMCILPLVFVDGARGALCLCRTEVRPFSEADIMRARRMVDLLPRLYETIRDEVAFKLSRELNECLQASHLDHIPEHIRDVELHNIIGRICKLVALGLETCEVSIFLSARDHPDEFILYGSTLSEQGRSVPALAYSTAQQDPSVPHMAPFKSSIRVRDLKQYQAAQPLRIDADYIEWAKSFAKDRPLSFLATPIIVGDNVIGIMRCCVLTAGPTFFAEREETLFKLLAGQIGHYISSQRARWALEQENSEWRVLVESVSNIITLVHKELPASQVDEPHVYLSSLKMIRGLIPGATFVNIRVYNKQTGRFASDRTDSRNDTKQISFPAEWVQELKAGAVIDLTKRASKYDLSLHPGLPHSDLERLIIAPIVSKDKCAVLELGHSGPKEFPKHASVIAQLIGEQLSLYHSFATAKNELNNKITQEERNAKAQTQTFMDLKHQIKTPLRHARRRVPIAIKIAEGQHNESIHKQLLFLRGILRRASSVASSIGLFADLASGKPIQINRTALSIAELRKLLIEAAMDSQVLVDEKRAVTFGFEEESFHGIPRHTKVDVDMDLLDQAINNLLDNAAKYSYIGSRVKISVMTTKNRVCVSVANHGLSIGHESIDLAKERGWRSPLAKATTGEGTGIGLWIVKNIMKAHGGELAIAPTTPRGLTEIRLMFPST